jgi:nucleoside-diphosphate-sugar epimerase
MNTVLVAGASGLVGSAALERFLQRDDFDVIAISRRKPDIDSEREFRHLSVDLRDADAARGALSALDGVTHIAYAAVSEKPGLFEGWQEQDQMQTNLEMMQNCIEPLARNGTLKHVTAMQGAKAYGIHLHPMRIPARERDPRDDHPNFYWLQEDYLKEKAAEDGFDWTILRPQLVIGPPIGTYMNIVPIIGVYAAICREEGQPFSYPGGASFVWEVADCRLVAAAFEFAATDPKAAGQHYNVTNGDVFEWRNLWPALADQLGVEPGPDEPRSMAEFLPAKADVWDRVVAKHDLKPNPLDDVLGESHHLADFCFAYGATEPAPPAFLSAIKLRQDGLTECYDTEETFRHWIGRLQDRRILPPA